MRRLKNPALPVRDLGMKQAPFVALGRAAANSACRRDTERETAERN